MSTQENIDQVQRAVTAFGTGDLAALDELLAPDAVWYAAGAGVLSGPKRGRDAVFAYLGGLMERSGGNFTMDAVDLAGSADRVFLLQHSHAEREGKVIDHDVVVVFRLADGAITEVREYFVDTAAVDAFWA